MTVELAAKRQKALSSSVRGLRLQRQRAETPDKFLESRRAILRLVAGASKEGGGVRGRGRRAPATEPSNAGVEIPEKPSQETRVQGSVTHTGAAIRLFRTKREQVLAQALEVSLQSQRRRKDPAQAGSMAAPKGAAQHLEHLHQVHKCKLMTIFASQKTAALRAAQTLREDTLDLAAKQQLARVQNDHKTFALQIASPDAATANLKAKIRSRMAVDQHIRTNLHRLETTRCANRILEERIRTLWELRDFLDRLAPAGYQEKLEGEL